MDEYRVKLPSFEGPLDLLLHLVRKNEYDILDIPIAEVTSQYLEFLDLMKVLNLDIAGEYLVMSATLLKIKSVMLLPRHSEEDLSEEEDPRADLIRQLLEYERFREAAFEMDQRSRLGRDVFARKFPAQEMKDAQSEAGFLEVSLFDLMEAFRDVLKKMTKEDVTIITSDRFSVRERMSQITELLSKKPTLLFENLFDEKTTKGEVITTFLAILELMRLQLMVIYQKGRFSPIHITSRLAKDEESGNGKGAKKLGDFPDSDYNDGSKSP